MVSAPAKIGKYEIIAEIGRGGMGTVYRARDPVLERILALKTMSPEVLSDAGMRERFLREARSAARLQHPNIVTVFEFGEVEGTPFIAMEFLEGDNLTEAAAKGRLPELGAKLAVVGQICDGLGYAHRHGVIHRDVKPSNVTILPNGSVKIVDFGIAWLEGGTTTTRTGVLLGTPAYMAPEQFSGEPIDHRVDIWAVGVILYELLNGRTPFDAATVPALIYQIVHAPAPPIDQRMRRLPPRLTRVLDQALAKDPRRRFPDLETMARALKEVRDDLPTAGRLGMLDGDLTPTLAVEAPAPFPRPSLDPAEAVTSRPRAPTVRTAFVEDGGFGEARRVQVILLSADDTLLFAGGTDGSIRLWDMATRMKVATFRNREHLRSGHGSLTTAMALSDDGAVLASGHLDGSIYLWEVSSGLELDVRPSHDGAIAGLAFAPGEALISTGNDATIRFWELPAARRGNARRSLRRQPDAATCLALAKRGRAVITGHTNRSLRVHDTASQRLVATIHGHRAPVSALAISPAGDLVASGSRDGAIRVHHIDTREQRSAYHEHTRAVSALTYFPDGRRIASVATDNVVLVWDERDPELPLTIAGTADDGYVCVCLTSDGKRLIAAVAEGHFRVWLLPG